MTHRATAVSTFTFVLFLAGALAPAAAGAETALWAQGDDGRAIQWSGSATAISGDVHSNGGLRIRGAGNSVAGSTTWVRNFSINDPNGAPHDLDPPPYQVEARLWPLNYEVAAYMPGGSAAIAAGDDYVDLTAACTMTAPGDDDDDHDEDDDHDDHRYCKNGVHHHGPQSSGDDDDDEDDDDDHEGGKHRVSLSFRNQDIPGRLYWAPCDISISARNAAGKISVVSSGKIHIKAHKDSNLGAFADGLLALSLASGNKAIHVNGNRSALHGNLVARSGQLHLAGSRQSLSCGIYADRIKLSGSRNVLSGEDCHGGPANIAPVAADDSADTAVDVPVAIPLLDNDSDADGVIDPASVTILNVPGQGSVSVNPDDGVATYSPASGFSGTDSFTYDVADDRGARSNTAVVTITVAQNNIAPVAVADQFVVAEDSVAEFDVLVNDYDTDGTIVASSTVVVIAPASGTAVVDPNSGIVTYTPDPDFFGVDEFTYTIEDNEGEVSNPAAVQIEVQPVNDAPVAVDDTFVLDEDSNVEMPLLANDRDIDSPLDASSVNVTAGPGNGTVVRDAVTGEWTYSPYANFNGTDSFQYVLVDANGASSITAATVTLTVTPVNDVPVADTGDIAVAEDGQVSLVLTAADVDGDPLTFTITREPSGLLQGTPPDLEYIPPPNFSGTDTFEFVASDGVAQSAPATVTVSVAPVNDAPVAQPQAVSTAEDVAVSIVLSGSDVEGDPLSYRVATAPASGILSGQPPQLAYTPNANFFGNDTFTFVVNDGQLDSASAQVEVTVAPVNDPPVATPAQVSLVEDGSISITLAGTDVDGDALDFQVTTGPANGALTGAAPNLVYTPAPDFNGSDSLSFTVSDGASVSDPAVVGFQVSAVNDAPQALPAAYDAVAGEPLAVTLAGSDVDGDTLTFAVTSLPANGSLGGTPPDLVYTPAAGFSGSDSLRFTVNDGVTDSAPATVSFSVTNLNSPPTIASAPPTTATVTAEYTYQVDASDPDGDALSYSLSVAPAGMTISATGLVSWQPSAAGQFAVTIEVSDGRAGIVQQSFEVLVSANQPPEFTRLPLLNAPLGEPYYATGEVVDPDGDTVSLVLADGPAGSSLQDLGNGLYAINWTGSGRVGDVTPFLVEATDSNGATSQLSLSVTTVGSTTDRSHLGTDFWFAYGINFRNTYFGIGRMPLDDPGRKLQVVIAAPQGATGTLEVPSMAIVEALDIPAGETVTIDLPNQLMESLTFNVRNSSVHVATDRPVTVAGVNWAFATTDAFLVMPTATLGSNYVVTGFKDTLFQPNSLEITWVTLATEDNTTVTINPIGDIPARDLGSNLLEPETYTLNRGEYIAGDMHHTHAADIDSDKPLAVFAGSSCANVPETTGTCDHLWQQFVPETSLASQYVAAPLATREASFYRVVAVEDDTRVSINGYYAARLDRGNMMERMIAGPVSIDATRPVIAVQYAVGNQFDTAERGDSRADPFMLNLAPVDSYLSDYVVVVPSGEGVFRDQPNNVVRPPIDNHYLAFTLPAESADTLLLDGVPVDTSAFEPIQGTSFVAGNVEVTPGSHRATAAGQFGVTVYGFGLEESYGYYAGLASPDGATDNLLTVTGPAGALVAGQQQACFDIRVTSIAGDPVPRARVVVDGTGTIPFSHTGFTSQSGTKEYCYTQSMPGTDTVTVTIAGDTYTQLVDWLPNGDAGVNGRPAITSLPEVVLYEQVFEYAIETVDPDGDSVAVTLEEGPTGASVVDGLLLWEPPIPTDRAATRHNFTVRASDGRGGTRDQRFEVTVHYPVIFVEEFPYSSGTQLFGGRVSSDFDHLGGDPDKLVAEMVAGPGNIYWAAVLGTPPDFNFDTSPAFIEKMQHGREFDPMCRVDGSTTGQFDIQPVWEDQSLALFRNVVAGPVFDSNGDGVVDDQDRIYAALARNDSVMLFDIAAREVVWEAGVRGVSLLSRIALANVDADIEMEVLAVVNTADDPYQRLTAYDPDGTLLWRSAHTADADGYRLHISRMPLLPVDLENDGSTEILIGPYVYDRSGNVLWQFDSSRINRTWSSYAMPLAADLDGDGVREVLFQNEVRDASGNLLWSLPYTMEEHRINTFYAVGDLDGDGINEVVASIYAENETYLQAFDIDGNALWPALSGTGLTRPIIGDFDRDGDREIFIPHGRTIVSAAGEIESSIGTAYSAARTQPLADLDQDGVLETLFHKGSGVARRELYGDKNWPSFGFSNQSPLFDDRALWQNIVYVDTDHDGQYEIFSAGFHGMGLFTGLQKPLPAPTRRYTSVIDFDQPTIGLDTGFGTPEPNGRPDPWVGEIALVQLTEDSFNLQVDVRNRGAGPVNSPVSVRFYRGRRADAQLLGEVVLPGLPGGALRTVSLPISSGDHDVVLTAEVVVDDGAAQCETGNDWVEGQLQTIEMRDGDTPYRTARYSYLHKASYAAFEPSQITAPANPVIELGQSYYFDIDANWFDPLSEIGNTVGYVLDVASRQKGISINASTGELRWTPRFEHVGTHSVTVTYDTPSRDNSSRFNIEVTARPNQPPVIQTAPPQDLVLAGSTFVYDVDATDSDNDTLTYGLSVFPAGMSINAQSGGIVWVPADSQVGLHDVTVTVDDGFGGIAMQAFTIQVGSLNNTPPSIDSTPPGSAKATFEFRYPVMASDPDGDPLTYSLSTAPAGMAIDATGLLTWTPAAAGSETVVVRVDDGQAWVEQGWTLQVSDSAVPLEASIGVSPNVAELGSSVTMTVGYSGAAGPVNAALTVDGQAVALDATYTATVPADSVGQHTATVIVSDDHASDSASTTYTVVDSSDPTPAPVVSLVAPDFDQEVTAPTDVIGSVSDDNLVRWFVALQEKGAPATEFTLLAEGATEVPEGVLAQIDPSMLLNGLYAVILQAEDASGNVTADSRIIRVTGDMKVGNFSVTFEDISIPVAGLPVTVLRTYDSRRRNEQLDFGYGWSVDYQNVRLQESRDIGFSWSLIEEDKGFFSDFCVRPNGDPTVTIRMPDGELESFVARAEPECTAFTPTVDVVIVFDPIDGTDSTLEQVDFGTVRINNNNIVDLGEPDTPIDPDNYRLTTPEGLVFELDQNFGIRQVTEPNGNTLTYSNAGIVHSQGFSLDFVRDGEGRITAINAPDGTTLSYGYDANGDLVNFTDQVLQTTTYTYRADLPHYLEDIVDPRGITVARNEYGPDGRLEAHIDAEGNRIEYTHDIAGRTETIRDRRGNATVYVYDDEGNVIAETNALGETTTRTYDEDRNETSMTDALGNTTSWTYDERGNQLSETDPLGNVTTSSYDDRNLLLSHVDPLGNTVMDNVYDANNTNLLTMTDALGNVTTFHWDSAIGTCSTGASRGTTDAEGNRSTIQPLCAGPFAELPAWEEDARGVRTSFGYDSLGRRVSESTTRTDVNGIERTLVTTMVYDDKSRVTQVTDPEGNITVTEYNAIDKEAATVDAKGNRTEFEYDSRGNRVLTRYADGTTETSAYDPENNVVAQTDRQGRTTRMTYDAANRLIETVYPDATPGNDLDNPRTVNEYDLAGRLTATIDERGNRTEYEYDAAGRRTLMRDALGNVTRFEYDARGLRTAVTDALGRRTAFVYDAAGRLVETVMPDSTPVDDSDNPRSFVTYDALGRKISETDLAGLTTQFEYDAVGNLTAVVDALGQRTEYGYDEQSNKISQTDAELRTTVWAYDDVGRVASRSLPEGQIETFSYDSNGNRSGHTDFNGAVHGFAHDDLNREVTATYADGTTVATTYTGSGQVESVTDDRGVTTYTYDERDRLASITYPTGKRIDYGYDDAGNRTSLSTANQSLTYTFDALNRLATVTDEAGVSTYGYSAVGSRTSIDYPNGTRTTYEYDEQNRLRILSQLDTTGTPFARHTYTLAPNGNRLQHAELSGRVADYSYDDLYRLSGEDVTDPTLGNRTTSFSYDAVGNRLARTETTAGGTTTTTYSYDSNDRLLTEVATGAEPGTTSYSYDANGNTLSKTDTSGTTTYGWDSRNRLIDLKNGQTAYRYDASGIRMSETTSGLTTHYLVDPNRDYAQVIEESLDLNSFADVRYSYGDDLLHQHRRVDATTSRASTYHYDGIGSTRQLTDVVGAVTDSYVFTAFGEVERKSGITSNDYLYAGEQFDPGLGFYYLRARYYQPDTGRFSAMDKFIGAPASPLSLNKYLYVHGDAINGVDPSGYFLVTETGAAQIRALLLQSATVNTANYAYRKVTAGILVLGAVALSTAPEVIHRTLLKRCLANGQDSPKCNPRVPVLIYGADVAAHTSHVLDAQTRGLPSTLTRIFPKHKSQWYRSDPVCKSKPAGTDCDEYPYRSTLQGGPTNRGLGLVSLRPMAPGPNRLAGVRLNQMYLACGIVANSQRANFVVSAKSDLPITRWICPK